MLPLEPVLVLDLFPAERAALLDLLHSLSDDDWQFATVCTGWSVKDVAAHLLGDDLGRLSDRDGYRGAAFVPSDAARFEAELLEFVNRMNETWVAAARRLSPQVFIDLLHWSGDQTQRYFEFLDLYAIGGPVTWAGPEPAPVWLDLAREYTERWLHQQQIRDAVGRPGLSDRPSFAPVLDTFVRALPHTFRSVDAQAGAHVKLIITGDAGGEWSLLRRDGRWALFRDVSAEPDATVCLDQDTAWRLFTKGIPKDEALTRTAIAGDPTLGLKVLDTVSIIT